MCRISDEIVVIVCLVDAGFSGLAATKEAGRGMSLILFAFLEHIIIIFYFGFCQ
jgi:hypothetical protein